MIPPPTPKADYDASTMGSAAAFDFSTASSVAENGALPRAPPQPSAPPRSPDPPSAHFQPSGMFNGIRGLYQEKMTSDPQYKGINTRLTKVDQNGAGGASKPNGPQKSASPTASSGQKEGVDAKSRFAALKVVSWTAKMAILTVLVP